MAEEPLYESAWLTVRRPQPWSNFFSQKPPSQASTSDRVAQNAAAFQTNYAIVVAGFVALACTSSPLLLVLLLPAAAAAAALAYGAVESRRLPWCLAAYAVCLVTFSNVMLYVFFGGVAGASFCALHASFA